MVLCVQGQIKYVASILISLKIHALPFYFLCNSRFELNFAVNVLGTYTITESMVPLLEKAAPDARVITVSSGGMYTAHLTDDLEVTISLSYMAAKIRSLRLTDLPNNGLNAV